LKDRVAPPIKARQDLCFINGFDGDPQAFHQLSVPQIKDVGSEFQFAAASETG